MCMNLVGFIMCICLYYAFFVKYLYAQHVVYLMRSTHTSQFLYVLDCFLCLTLEFCKKNLLPIKPCDKNWTEIRLWEDWKAKSPRRSNFGRATVLRSLSEVGMARRKLVAWTSRATNFFVILRQTHDHT